MSMLTELRARKKAPRTDEKKLYSLGSEPSKPTEVSFEGYEGAIPQESQFFLQSEQTAVAAAEPDQTTLEPPVREDRLCYQCQHFQRSSYGFPLGLCQQHGDRIQHTTSQPTQFGCGKFAFRQASDDNKTCTECRHYNPLSTMCSQVNTGCPYPSIPPCSGTKFQHKLKAIKLNKEVAE